MFVQDAGQRELLEETGIDAGQWVSLGFVNCANSLSNHRDHAFFATCGKPAASASTFG